MISKPDKDNTKKENYRWVSLMYVDAETLNKVLANGIKQHIKWIIQYNQVEFIPGLQGWFNICKSTCYNIFKITINSINAEKAFNKIQHPFVIKGKKTFQQSECRVKVPQNNKGHVWQAHS